MLNAAAALGTRSEESDDAGGSSADIPARMLAAYKKAAQLIHGEVPSCKGLVWPVLAGIAKVESNHAIGHGIAANGDIRPRIYGVLLNGSGAGGNTSAVADTDGGKWDGTAQGERAVGPFQFLPSTWESTGRDANGDEVSDPHNADDAALGAAVYLCGHGRDLTQASQLRSAIYQYNHSDAYVDNVLGWISQYRASGAEPDLTRSPERVRKVVEAAMSQRGIPYSWGGGNSKGPSTGGCCSPGGKSGTSIRGYDCSGLMMYAFAHAGRTLPHLASAQAGFGTRIPPSSGTGALRVGDLVFFAFVPGRDSTIHHVGLYVGNGQMIDAARPGTNVRLDPVDAMSGFAGGARLL
ncbi:C40 family peptidase [Streptomyces sp. NBC_01500]|uniref:C40 family peptidase n=1 Tax=Streptomyces sp. NBC_01500 TaxID=2903886 RepID=UPI002253E401|nr:bifunctional lytic transglycosylase/C40 family peptidase [Streptomyces sp. NBC_01500]MCX4554227.1 NlpC/P60 family protein [Streptomyces sp. NBC_01500]